MEVHGKGERLGKGEGRGRGRVVRRGVLLQPIGRVGLLGQ